MSESITTLGELIHWAELMRRNSNIERTRTLYATSEKPGAICRTSVLRILTSPKWR